MGGEVAPSSYLDDPVLPELRDALRTNWPCMVDDLLVVDGAMDALDLITRTLFRPGDRVLVENPGFPPLLDLLEDRGVDVAPVGVDDSGPVLDDVAAGLPRKPVAIVIQPRGQNPTGVSITPTRARRLASLLAPTSVLVIEDDSAGDIASSRDLSLGEWLPDRVLHIRSFSKSYGPDLRLAAVSGPASCSPPSDMPAPSARAGRVDCSSALSSPCWPTQGRRRRSDTPGASTPVAALSSRTALPSTGSPCRERTASTSGCR